MIEKNTFLVRYPKEIIKMEQHFSALQHCTEGHIKIFFYSKNLVEACVGATGLDWVFPEPK